MKGKVLRSLSGGAMALMMIFVAPAPTRAATVPTGSVVRGTAASANVHAIPGPKDFFRLKNVNSGKCLVGQGTDPGRLLFQYQCLAFEDQYWHLVPLDDGYDWIENLNSGLCVVVQGTANRAQAFQYICSPFVDQEWGVFEDDNGNLMLKNHNSGKCLVARGGGDGAIPFQYDCHPEFADQWWAVSP